MPHIFLYGPSGSGKTTVGKALAEYLRLLFVDSDQIIETNAGMTIPQIVEAYGMTKLRDFETAALEQIVKDKESVIALGGGALLREENRALVEMRGKVILLKAELPTLIERLQNDPHERPLLADDLKSKLAEYLEGRKEHYNSFQRTIQVDGKTPEQISREIQTLVGRHRLSAMGEYDVQVGQIGNLPYGNLIVTDENVAKHHLKKFGVEKSIVLPAGEEHKNLETVSRLWKAFLENGLDRKSVVIALGGGVIGDLTGFAASTFMRGIDWIAIPTTLLAMVDASLGGKTGFDLPEGKNLIGSFHPPRLVLADPSLLRTLSDRDLRSGMAEVVKHGIISDPELFALCANSLDWVKNNMEEIVKRAMAVKIRIIEEDPYEKGIRATLNLGHTVGHAVELASGFKLSHGEAVSIGMAVEARYAERIGVAKKGLTDEIEKILSGLGLPAKIPNALPRDQIIRAMRVDKKRNEKSIRFALPVEIGKIELVDVDDLDNVIASEAKQSHR
ncbi:MAG: 3-dehydroquinate synthase [Anaerolineales bacterium]|nr:MAG: 3-dehydroquinate synthase [Anaerolineales bacterium]